MYSIFTLNRLTAHILDEQRMRDPQPEQESSAGELSQRVLT